MIGLFKKLSREPISTKNAKYLLVTASWARNLPENSPLWGARVDILNKLVENIPLYSDKELTKMGVLFETFNTVKALELRIKQLEGKSSQHRQYYRFWER